LDYIPVSVIDFGGISPLAKDHSISSAEGMAAANLIDDAAAQCKGHIVVVTVGDRVAAGTRVGGQEID
jgi:hypothetical protein